MKIRSVSCNNRRRAFEVVVAGRRLGFPFAKADPRPTPRDPVIRVYADPEAAREAFTYVLASGREGTIPADAVLEYNRDPALLRDLLLYRMTIEAQKRIATAPVSRREIIRRLDTSAAQFYRLLDPANTRKSVDQMLRLLSVLDCDVALVVRAKSA